MTRRPRVRQLARSLSPVLLFAGGLAFAAFAWRPLPTDVPAPRVIGAAPGVRSVPTADSLAALVGVARSRDPFRVDGVPPEVRFDPLGIYTPPPPPPPPPERPVLELSGLILGPSPSAIVEGIPEADGATVLRVGETVGGIRFEAVRGDTAILRGYDTLWALTPRGYDR